MLYAAAKCPKCGAILGKVHQYPTRDAMVPRFEVMHRGIGFEIDEEDGKSHVTLACYGHKCGRKYRLQRRGHTYALIWEDGVRLIEP